jgi:phosphatidylinositol alpha-1,6-mannosyltransferase
VKILVVTNDFPPRIGGIQSYVEQLLIRLPATTDVTVFASTSPGAEEYDRRFPHRVVRIPTGMMLPTPGVFRHLVRLARAERPDIVLFGASMPLALMGTPLERRTGVPDAPFTHGLEISAARLPGGRSLLRRIGRGAVLVTAVSNWTRELFRPFIPDHVPFELLPSGIDVERFHSAVSDAGVRARHGLDDRPVICCVSRLVARKGFDTIIRALPRIASSHPEVRFLAVGRGPDERRLRALALSEGVADRVVFAGSVPYAELPAYFRAGDVFAMPCRSRFFGLEVEALGAVFLQAAAVARPVVVGRSGGAPEAVLDGETGLVADPTSPTDVGARILALLDDPTQAAAMGHAGAEWVHRELTWDAMASKLQGMLDAALRGRRQVA